jgi:hypothetical protein
MDGGLAPSRPGGDAAAAIAAESGCWGSVSFLDFFLLARINRSCGRDADARATPHSR